MAMAKAICTCKKCGKTFEKRKQCNNRADANSYEEWAKENITECPDCYYARKAAEKEEKAQKIIAEYNLPAIEGVSEKQIAYATLLRNKAIIEADKRAIQNAFEIVSEYIKNPDVIQKYADERANGDTEEVRRQAAEASCFDVRLFKLFELSNAGKIIDLLK